MSRLKVRLSSLSHDELLELATKGCAADMELRNRADALIAQRTPLPGWCVDVMLSPDLLSNVLEHTTLGDKAAATVSHVWAEAWMALLRRRCYLRPKMMRTLRPHQPNGKRVQPSAGHVMPDGKIIVADFGKRGHLGDPIRLEVLSPDGDVLRVHPGALREWRFEFVNDMLEHDGNLFVADMGAVSKLRLSDGEDMGFVQDLGDPEHSGEPCSLAIGGGELFVALGDHVCVLDPQTLQTKRAFGQGFLDVDRQGDSVSSVAIDGEEVWVAEWRMPYLSRVSNPSLPKPPF